MGSLAAASLSADHVQRRAPALDGPRKTGDFSHLFAEPAEVAPAAPPPPRIEAAKPPEPVRSWVAFPIHHEERHRIESRGHCAPVTHADMMRRIRTAMAAPPARTSPSLPQRLMRAVGLGRARPAES